MGSVERSGVVAYPDAPSDGWRQTRTPCCGKRATEWQPLGGNGAVALRVICRGCGQPCEVVLSLGGESQP